MCDTYEEIEHTADVAIRVTASDFSGLLKQAALGMLHLMGILGNEIIAENELKLSFDYVSKEDILVQALNEVIFQLETGNVAYIPDQVVIDDQHAKVHYSGCKWDQDFSEIKAVTYHQMEIVEDFPGLHCMVVFDV
jgi:SHS2 domain-containing protein